VFNIGPAELMVIFVLALLVFGPKKLPEVSKQIGRGIREFRKASDQFQGEIQGALNLDEDGDETTDEAAAPPPIEASASTQPVSSNGHSADSATAVPEATEDPGTGDDGNADGPAASERTD